MSEERNWTTIGVSRDVYERFSKLRAYFEYLTGERINLGEASAMGLGWLLSLISLFLRVQDKMEKGDMKREDIERELGRAVIKEVEPVFSIKRRTGED